MDHSAEEMNGRAKLNHAEPVAPSALRMKKGFRSDLLNPQHWLGSRERSAQERRHYFAAGVASDAAGAGGFESARALGLFSMTIAIPDAARTSPR